MTAFRRGTRFAFVAVSLALASACDDDPTASSGAIQIAVTPATTVQRGSGTFVDVTVSRTGGFDGAVRLTISNLPDGVIALLDPADLPSGTSRSRINLAASPTAALGDAIVTIAASSPDVNSATAVVTLTVMPGPDFALSVTPSVLTIAAGASDAATVNIERDGYQGPVRLVGIAPSGIQAAFAPSTSTTNASTMTITVGANVAPGTYPLTVSGTGDYLPDYPSSVQFQVTVVPAPTAGNNVEYQFCDPSTVPVFFARQDGAGAWQPVVASSSGGVTRFGFNLASGRGGVMMVFQSTEEEAARYAASARGGRWFTPAVNARRRSQFVSRSAPWVRSGAALVDVFFTQVLFGSTAELAQAGADNCAATLPTKTVTATVSGLVPGQYGVIALGGITRIFNPVVSTNPFTLAGVQGGLADFVATRIAVPGNAPDRMIVLRNIDVPDGAALPAAINFDGPSSVAPATATTTINGAAGDVLEVYTELVSATSYLLYWFDLKPSQVSSRPWAGLPAAAMLPGDVHGVVVFAAPPSSPDEYRVASKYVGPVGNQTIDFGPIVTPANATQVAVGAYPRFRLQGTLPPEYNKVVGFQITGESSNVFNALATAAYLGAAGSVMAYDLTMPDVAGLPGFPAGARLTAGANQLSTDAWGFTAAGGFEPRPVLGMEFKSSLRISQIVVP